MALFIEPAPYITRLDQELKKQWSGKLITFYITETASQEWESRSAVNDLRILSRQKIRALCTLWRYISHHRPEVVFVAGWFHPLVVATILMSKLTGAHVVASSDTWRSESRGVRRRVRKFILGLIDRFAAGGKRQESYLSNLGLPSGHIFKVNMTVDTNAMQAFFSKYGREHRVTIRNELGVDDRACIFLFVGRLESIKGIDLLLSAFSSLETNIEARLIVVGDGSLRSEVETAMQRDTRILYRGRLEGQALWALFSAADALVAPSRSEPWGLVVNEALAAGLGVVVSDSFGCIDDLIHPDQNALVIAADNSAALCIGLKRLASDPQLLSRLKGNAKQSIVGWTTEAWAANVLKIWRNAIELEESSDKNTKSQI